ncbi:hypothetical protein BH23CHL4_BH23CHL4_26380 [soil metagenome]
MQWRQRTQFIMSMKRLILGLGGLAIVLTMVTGSVATTNAAHLGNNKAEIVGTGDPDAEGQSTVNYREGTGSFNASATVSNLMPGETYTFGVQRGRRRA